MKLIRYKTAKITQLKKDDILVFSCKECITAQEFKQEEEYIKTKLGKVKFVILDNGMTVERFRKGK